MSMQSHLAELEKRHQALEDEINECLAHPAVDDLRIVELKRRKLLVKDEIERLRHNGHASVHSRETGRQIFHQAELGKPDPAKFFAATQYVDADQILATIIGHALFFAGSSRK